MHCGNSRLTPTEKCVVEGEEQRSAAQQKGSVTVLLLGVWPCLIVLVHQQTLFPV